MKFASLGSGSEGNALLVSAGKTSVLMDCGFSVNETVARLARLDVLPEQLSGILVTHEHGDHARGVVRFARKFGLAVWLTHGTWRGIQAGEVEVREINSQDVFAIGDLEIRPYPVPHDAAEPVQFVFGDGQRRLGVLTDAGCSTPHIENVLSGCDALVLECNHDRQMLQNGSYPPSLKQRVGGRLGHLSNDQAADILARLDTRRLQHLLAAHLSAQNNQPDLAVRALSEAMGCEAGWIGVATQAEGADWREIV